MKAFVDASPVLDVFEGSTRGLRFAAPSDPSFEWCYSPLVRLECRIQALAQNSRQRLVDVGAILAPMTRLDLTGEVFDHAAEIHATTGIKTPDAIHVATALTHECDELWTADARIGRVAVPGLRIEVLA